jgi:mono/diheme cytochrome c family protein
MRFKLQYITLGVLTLICLIWARQVGAEQGRHSEHQGQTERGEYLVNSVGMCGDCHTQLNAQGMRDSAKELQGASLPIRPKKEIAHWMDKAPDITCTGLGGQWSEDQMVKFLTTGIDPNGEKAHPPMPAFRLDESDARAVYIYVQSLPHIKKHEHAKK